MGQKILSVSERGQVTIPKKIRDQFPVENFTCSVENGKIIFEPVVFPSFTSQIPAQSIQSIQELHPNTWKEI